MKRLALYAPSIVIATFALSYYPLTIGQTQRSEQCVSCVPKELPPGAIKGYVFDSRGRLVVGAIVHAEKTDLEKGLLPSTATDVDGFFLLQGLEPGEYIVYAGKASQGYPETLSALYSDAISRSNTIVNNGSADELVLKLKQPLRQLIGRIVDLRTGRPISSATITVRAIDNPHDFLETGPDEKGRFRLLLPPIAFTLRISATGYETWTYVQRGPSALGPVVQSATRKKIIGLRSGKK